MNPAGTLADLLDARREAIRERWRQAVAAEPDAPRPADPFDPAALLDRIAARLRQDPPAATDPTAPPWPWPAGAELAAVVQGLGRLRRVLGRECARLIEESGADRGRFAGAVEAVHEMLDAAIADAVARLAPAPPPADVLPRPTCPTAADRAVAERLRLATSAFPGVVYDLDFRTRRVVRSGGLERLTGYPTDAAEGGEGDPSWWTALVHPDDLPGVRAGFEACVARRETVCESEYRIRHRDGRWLWVWDRALLHYDADGQVTRMVGITLDIDDRRRAEAALRAEETRFRATFETSAIGIAHVGFDGRFLRVNARMAQLLGRTPADLVGRNFRDLTYPDDLASSEAQVQDLLAGRHDTYGLQKRFVRADGRPIWIQVTVSLARGADGTPLYAIGFYEDIDERRRAEAVLARYQLLTRHGRDIILFVRPEDGRIVEANDAAVAAYGYDRDALIGLPITALRSDAQRDRAGAQLRAADSEGVLFETEHRRRDGTTFPVEVSARGADVGGDRLVVSIIRDISERRRAEAALREGTDRLRLATEATGLATWDWDLRSGRITWSGHSAAVFDLPPEAAISPEQLLERVHPDDRELVARALRDALDPAGPGTLEVDFRVPRADPPERWVIAKGRTEFAGSGPGRQPARLIGTALDITRRKELETELARQRAAAEDASRHKSRLLSALSHDARTPLNAVVLSSELLELHVRDDADPEVAECLRTIRHSVRNVLDLLNDLLDLTRIDAGVATLEPSRFELAPALVECFASVEAQARQKGLAVGLDLGPVAGLVVETDRAKLKQILSNFLSNALRYTERGHLRLITERRDGHTRLAVEDTGPGIAPHDQERIFDEFARIESRARSTGEGTGLGLAICRRLAGLLGAEIEVQSTPGRGSTFALILPPAALVAPGTPARGGPDDRTDPARDGAILIAEDHADSRRMLARVLRRLGYRVLEAENGHEALAAARREPPVAILMDVNMPGLDGVEAIRALRAEPALARIPVLVLTGDVTPANHQRIDDVGVQGYLEKPVTADALRSALTAIGLRP